MENMYSLIFDSSFGNILIASNKKAIVSLSLVSTTSQTSTNNLSSNNSEDNLSKNNLPDVLLQCKSELELYFSRKLTIFTVPLAFNGTDMQNAVWRELIKIPYGKTVSYKDLSLTSGYEKAFRAVGTAVGKNNIPIIIPCHRVIRSNGNLGGFALGLDKKLSLLQLENINININK